ncbi:hypothetical protein N0V94_003477 [Neodidymelliopsis sp. IMI 364377]|nr:hypothetical protein N0V94_003477 [Neodidymelliopsis sp. IMI 364377]
MMDGGTRKLCRDAMYSARSDCFSISTLMYKKLPKELRDVVYSYLCLEDRRIPVGPYYHFRKYEPFQDDKGTDDPVAIENDTKGELEEQYFERWLSSHEVAQTILPDGRIRTDHDIYPPSDFVMPESHIFQPSYMGKDVVLEALATYYKGNSFSVCNVKRGLEYLFTHGLPASEGPAISFAPIDHICDLQIRLKCEHLDTELYTLATESENRLAHFAREELFLRHTIESLAGFRSRIQSLTQRELSVEIVLMTDLPSCTGNHEEYVQVRTMNLLQTTRGLVYELMYDLEHATVRVTHQDDNLMAFPRNYTRLFHLTKDQWTRGNTGQHDNHDWKRDFWVIPVEDEDVSRKQVHEHGGYLVNDVPSYLRERWGIANTVHGKPSSSLTGDDEYQHLESPYHPEAAKKMIEKLLQEESKSTEDKAQHRAQFYVSVPLPNRNAAVASNDSRS